MAKTIIPLYEKSNKKDGFDKFTANYLQHHPFYSKQINSIIAQMDLKELSKLNLKALPFDICEFIEDTC